MTDSELVAGMRRDDPGAYRELVRRYAGDMYALAFSLVGNAADAEDVVQQALVGAVRGVQRFEGRSALKTWLYSIVANQASKARRAKRVRRAASLDANDLDVPQTRAASASVDGRLDLMTMLDALSAEHRQVMVLREIEGLTYDEIAEAVGVPRGTVESRLFRARRALRERFADHATR